VGIEGSDAGQARRGTESPEFRAGSAGRATDHIPDHYAVHTLTSANHLGTQPSVDAGPGVAPRIGADVGAKAPGHELVRFRWPLEDICVGPSRQPFKSITAFRPLFSRNSSRFWRRALRDPNLRCGHNLHMVQTCCTNSRYSLVRELASTFQWRPEDWRVVEVGLVEAMLVELWLAFSGFPRSARSQHGVVDPARRDDAHAATRADSSSPRSGSKYAPQVAHHTHCNAAPVKW